MYETFLLSFLLRFLDMHMYVTSALQRTDMKAVGLQLALDLLHEKVRQIHFDAKIHTKYQTKSTLTFVHERVGRGGNACISADSQSQIIISCAAAPPDKRGTIAFARFDFRFIKCFKWAPLRIVRGDGLAASVFQIM